MEGWTAHATLFTVGLLAGAVNVVAGGGSFLTLPVLMFLGLPAGIANGTNRVGIVLQNVAAVWRFEHHGVLDRRLLPWAVPPALLGAILGVRLALVTDDLVFRRILAVLMLAISVWTLWSPGRFALREVVAPGIGLAGVFFLIGVYGGFVQAGVGFFVLAATSLAGLDLVRGNAVKVLIVLCFATLALALFAWNGRVVWVAGLTLGAGTVAGGLIGVRLTVLKGHVWVRRVVTLAVIACAVRLLVGD